MAVSNENTPLAALRTLGLAGIPRGGCEGTRNPERRGVRSRGQARGPQPCFPVALPAPAHVPPQPSPSPVWTALPLLTLF